MTVLDLIFLPVIVTIGCITSYDDFCTSRIRNCLIFLGLGYVFVVYGFAWIVRYVAVQSGVQEFTRVVEHLLFFNFSRWAINLLVSTLVAYALWHFSLWGAGDGKLFICYSALIPLRWYPIIYFDYYFASFVVLALTFCSATAYLCVRAICHFSRAGRENQFIPIVLVRKVKSVRRKDAWEWLKVFLGFVFFLLMFKVLRINVRGFLQGVIANKNIIVFLCIIIFRPLAHIFRKKMKLTVVFFGVMVAVAFLNPSWTVSFSAKDVAYLLLSAAVLIGICSGVRRLLDVYVDAVSRKTLSFAPWMFFGVLLLWFWRFVGCFFS